MQAEVLGIGARFEVQQNESGAAPERMVIVTRPCWQKPPVRLDLELIYEFDGVAYYAAITGAIS